MFLVFSDFFWTERNATRGDYIVKADTMLKISWHLDSSDRVEGGFTVSSGYEELKFYVENPSGDVILDQSVKSRFDGGFTAYQLSGTYSLYFENMENTDKTIHLGFVAPYESYPALSVARALAIGLLMMVVSAAALFYGAYAYRHA